MASAVAFAVLLDLVKVPLFRRLNFSSPALQSSLTPSRITADRSGLATGARRLQPALLLLGLTIAFGAASYGIWDHFEAGLPVGVVSGVGRIEAREFDIATTLPGCVSDLLVDEGAAVTAGQVLAHIDTKDLDALLEHDATRLHDLQTAIEKAVPQMAQTRARFENERQLYDRTSRLQRKGRATSKFLDRHRRAMNRASADLTAAQAKIEETKAKLDAVEREMEQNRTDIADGIIRAPRAGRVLHRVVKVGEAIPLGAKVFTMLDAASLQMDIHLLAADAAKLKVGMGASIVLDTMPKLSISATVSSVGIDAKMASPEIVSKSPGDTSLVRIRLQIDDALFAHIGSLGVAYIHIEQGIPRPSLKDAAHFGLDQGDK